MLYRKVCPSKCGAPMTRNRLHFQGVRKGLFECEDDALKDIADSWDLAHAGPFPVLPLNAFLIREGSDGPEETCAYIQSLRESGELAPNMPKNGARQGWRKLHAKYISQTTRPGFTNQSAASFVQLALAWSHSKSFRPNLKVHSYTILPHSDLTTGGTLFSLRLQSVGVWFEPNAVV